MICLADEDDVNTNANTVTIRGNDTSVRIEGNTGKIKAVHFDKDDDDEELEEEDFDDDEEMLTFQVDSLEEKDSNGNVVGLTGPTQRKHALTSLVNQIQKFSFSPLNNSTTFQGLPVKRINLSVSLAGPQANLEIQVLLFLKSGKIEFGNETFNVRSGTFKFNIKVSDWKFCGTNSEVCKNSATGANETGQFLDIGMSIGSVAEEPEEVEDGEIPGEDICVPEEPDEEHECPRIFNMGGNSEMMLNKGALTGNNEYVLFPTGFPKFERKGLMKTFVFRVPRFNNTVLIDPSVNVGTMKKGGGKSGAGYNAAQSPLFFCFVLLLCKLVTQ